MGPKINKMALQINKMAPKMKKSATSTSSRLGNLTAAHGWKVGAGNGPDVWGLEGELGGEVELLLLPLVVVGGHGGSHRVRGGGVHQAPGRASGHV